PTQNVTVPANETRVLRVYVMLPPEVKGADDAIPFTFRLTARDEQRESDAEPTTFALPEDE
ncbi:MAG: hypothetical protein RIT17_1237, partial [Pseudomonadota bacterium]